MGLPRRGQQEPGGGPRAGERRRSARSAPRAPRVVSASPRVTPPGQFRVRPEWHTFPRVSSASPSVPLCPGQVRVPTSSPPPAGQCHVPPVPTPPGRCPVPPTSPFPPGQFCVSPASPLLESVPGPPSVTPSPGVSSVLPHYRPLSLDPFRSSPGARPAPPAGGCAPTAQPGNSLAARRAWAARGKTWGAPDAGCLSAPRQLGL